MRVDEHKIELASVPVYYRSAPATGPLPVYLHDVPTSCDDWEPMLELTGGMAPDLMGFGRSGKGGHLDYTVRGLAGFVEDLLAELGVAELRLVGHGWGAVIALELAAHSPQRIARLALVDPLPLVAGHTWSGLARLWRTRGLGELAMGSVTRRVLGRHLRAGTVESAAWAKPRVEAAWAYFDQGTQRAVLRLHRATEGQQLSTLAGRLATLRAPTLVLRGECDPWVAGDEARAVAELMPAADVVEVSRAGHWPWLESQEAAGVLAGFVADGSR